MSKFTTKFKKITSEYASLQIFAKRAPTAFKKFMDEVELLAADTYAHEVENGFCCSCSVDIAFMEYSLMDRGWTPPDGWVEEREKMQAKILKEQIEGNQKRS
jgi:hypothetical protein